jgi:rhamnogalacturonyl hydrolase YesR
MESAVANDSGYEIRKTIDALLDWIEKNDAESYDPYDIYSTDFGLILEKNDNVFVKPIRTTINIAEFFCPYLLRFAIKKKKSATSAALYASSLLNMYRFTKDPRYLERAETQLSWLERNVSTGYHGYCWGLPFNWQLTRSILAEKGTPCSTIILYMVDAFINAYEITDNNHYRDIAQKTADFFLKDLNKNVHADGTISLSYTPIDSIHVINVNSYAAASLYEIYRFTKNQDHKEFADRLIDYVLREQNKDGSWSYWGREAQKPPYVDSLHQCYILENCYRCYRINHNKEILNSIHRGLYYYKNNFINDCQISKYSRYEKKWKRANQFIHLIDLAEAIFLFTLLSESFETRDLLDDLLTQSLPRFKRKNQSTFFSTISPFGKKSIPYMRWGHVQLLYALIMYYLIIQEKNSFDIL